MIVAVSDGVHDNLHPRMLFVSPRDLKLDFDTWEEAAKVINTEAEAAKYRVQSLERLIADIDCNPASVLKRIIDHCSSRTYESRKWMETNRGKKLPSDYSKYPGKMDHTTCVVFRVGIAHGTFSRSRFVFKYFLVLKHNNNSFFIVLKFQILENQIILLFVLL